MVTAQDFLEKSSLEVFELVTGQSVEDVAKLILKSTLFIDPKLVQDTPVQFPNCVRESNQYHHKKTKGEKSTWDQFEVNVWDNTKARDAFGKYIGKRMGGKDRQVAIGWEVAHVWGRVFDPEYFTAGWNMVFMPGFLRILTEEQSKIPQFQNYIQYVAHNLYFEKNLVSIPKTDPRKPDESEMPDWIKCFQPNLLKNSQGSSRARKIA